MYRKLILCILSVFLTVNVISQNTNIQNLSNTNTISPQNPNSINGLNESQLKLLLQQNEKLKSSQFKNGMNEEDLRFFENDSVLYDESLDENDEIQKLENFGHSFFKNNKLNFEPSINIPTPKNYILGYNDELIIDISGLYDVTYNIKVTPDGYIRVPNVGPIKVGGEKIENAEIRIKNSLKKYYNGLNTGETKVLVSLGNIRSIKIYIIGDATYPGTYSLPSLSNAFNALFYCGGPNETGSLRNVSIIRNQKTISTLDFYEFLLNGKVDNNISLQDNDILKFETNKSQIKIDGAINRPAIYEIKEGETLAQIINYAGGFKVNANKQSISLYRIDNNIKNLVTLKTTDLNTNYCLPGDSIFISEVRDIYTNKVTISGEVKQPGDFSLDSVLTVKRLIETAGGLTDAAYDSWAIINRQNKNEIPQKIGFSPKSIINGESTDIALANNDYVFIDTVTNFVDSQFVSILGEVNLPGKYQFKPKSTILDLIFEARGIKENASLSNILLIRTIKDPAVIKENGLKSISKLLNLEENSPTRITDEQLELESGDVVTIKPISGFEEISTVQITGEVVSPGLYHIKNKLYRISDLLKESGGLSKDAFSEGIMILRPALNDNKTENNPASYSIDNLKKLLSNQSGLQSSISNAENFKNFSDLIKFEELQSNKQFLEIKKMIFNKAIIPVDIKEVVNKPGSKNDIILIDGDIVYVPTNTQTIKVIGEVLYPTVVLYDRNSHLGDYIKSSGGFTDNSSRKNVFVLYANGRIMSTKRFMGMNLYPRIENGSTIIVPKKELKLSNKLTVAELISISTSMSSALVLIYSILRNN